VYTVGRGAVAEWPKAGDCGSS